MSKKLPIYFSDHAWSILQIFMGENGAASPTINALLEQIAAQKEIVEKFKLTPVNPTTKVAIPVALERFPAGPAFATKDDQEKTLDLNELLIRNPISTFMGYVDSESMLDEHFLVGNLIAVDRSIDAQHYDIVLALIDNKDSTLKRLMITSKMSKFEIEDIFGDANYPLPSVWLKAENAKNSDYKNIIPAEDQTISVWGVVTANIQITHTRSQ